MSFVTAGGVGLLRISLPPNEGVFDPCGGVGVNSYIGTIRSSEYGSDDLGVDSFVGLEGLDARTLVTLGAVVGMLVVEARLRLVRELKEGPGSREILAGAVGPLPAFCSKGTARGTSGIQEDDPVLV